MNRRLPRILAALLALAATGPCVGQGVGQPYTPPQHTAAASPDNATQFETDRPAGYALAEHRRLTRALATLVPGRKGVVDAYVVSVALDSDPVFGREAREAARVLSRRYHAAGRTLVLAGSDGTAASSLPMGSPANIAAALARVAEVMDRQEDGQEDVLILYTTSHGAPYGIAYHDGDAGFGAISPARLKDLLEALGIKRRILLLSACYSGVFIQPLSSPDTAIVTAASSDRTSFGCFSDNDWTFFGDALINHALRKPTRFAPAVEEARQQIAGWEHSERLEPSQPSVLIGGNVARWLAPLEARIPVATTQPVGRPASEALAKLEQTRRERN